MRSFTFRSTLACPGVACVFVGPRCGEPGDRAGLAVMFRFGALVGPRKPF
jgi:hypothetical protein